MAALAQATRLEVFRYLIRQGLPGAPAGRIGEALALHAATLSFHLAALRRAGLVASRRESRSIIYTANYGQVNELIGFLVQNCCQGEDAGSHIPASRTAASPRPARRPRVSANSVR